MRKRSVFVVVKGRVQGVGFRWFVKEKADELDITGWVRNASNGNVEIEATGDYTSMESFVDWIKIGTSMSVIREVSVSDFQPVGDKLIFSIRH